jgi:hypothetical protein
MDAAAPNRMGAIGAPVTGKDGVPGDLSLTNDPDGLVRLMAHGVDWHLDRSWWPWPGGWRTPHAASGRLYGLPVRVRLSQDRHIRSCFLEGPWPAPLEDRSSGDGWCASGSHWQKMLDHWKKLRKEKGLGDNANQVPGSSNAGSWPKRPTWGSWSLAPPDGPQRLLRKWLAEPPDGSRWFRWQPTRWQAMVQAPVDAGYPILWTETTTGVARSLYAQLVGEVRFADPSMQRAASLPERAEIAEGWQCPICGLGDWPTGDAGPRQACDRCGTVAHHACREFLGHCSLFGCDGNPKPPANDRLS